MRVSASLIQDYVSCPQKCFFRIWEKEEELKSQDSLAGTLFHTFAEKNWDRHEDSLEFLQKIPEFNLLDLKHSEKLSKCIYNFLNLELGILGKEDEVEKWFEVRLHSSSDFLVGKMDRVLPNGVVIDWKTSSVVPTENSIKRDIQFLIYDYAYEKLYGKRAILLCVNVNQGKIIQYTRDEIIFDTFFHYDLMKILGDIHISNFQLLGIYNGACFMCPYKHKCNGGSR